MKLSHQGQLVQRPTDRLRQQSSSTTISRTHQPLPRHCPRQSSSLPVTRPQAADGQPAACQRPQQQLQLCTPQLRHVSMHVTQRHHNSSCRTLRQRNQAAAAVATAAAPQEQQPTTPPAPDGLSTSTSSSSAAADVVAPSTSTTTSNNSDIAGSSETTTSSTNTDSSTSSSSSSSSSSDEGEDSAAAAAAAADDDTPPAAPSLDVRIKVLSEQRELEAVARLRAEAYYEHDRSRFAASFKKQFAAQEVESLRQRTAPTVNAQRPQLCDCLVAVEGSSGAVVACIDIRLPQTSTRMQTIGVPEGDAAGCYLVNVVVAEEHRGLGVGKQVMRAAMSRAVHHWGAQRLYTHVEADNEVANRLYRSCGFEEHSSEAKYANTLSLGRLVLLMAAADQVERVPTS